MKIAIISNKKNVKMHRKCESLIQKISLDKGIYIKSLDIISNIKELDNEYDIYMLATNSIDELFLFARYIKKNNKSLILTENTNVNFIMNCIDFTKNLLYINVDINIILEKIYSIYVENYNFSNKRL